MDWVTDKNSQIEMNKEYGHDLTSVKRLQRCIRKKKIISFKFFHSLLIILEKNFSICVYFYFKFF
jgi:hypothetical protein